ncbi:MAG: hypothetical protein DMD48_00740, partial [Gemmatimonadetes bacterium]
MPLNRRTPRFARLVLAVFAVTTAPSIALTEAAAAAAILEATAGVVVRVDGLHRVAAGHGDQGAAVAPESCPHLLLPVEDLIQCHGRPLFQLIQQFQRGAIRRERRVDRDPVGVNRPRLGVDEETQGAVAVAHGIIRSAQGAEGVIVRRENRLESFANVRVDHARAFLLRGRPPSFPFSRTAATLVGKDENQCRSVAVNSRSAFSVAPMTASIASPCAWFAAA